MGREQYWKVSLSAVSAAVIVLGCSDAAQAAGLGNIVRKAPPAAPKSVTCTNIQGFFATPCQLSWYGVRFYGAIDVGAGYKSNGTRFAPESGAGVNYFPGKSSVGGKWLFAPNALSGSNLGVQIKEPLVVEWSFIGQLEAGFNPYSLRLANSVHSIFVERGIPLGQQNAAADSNSRGQFYNNLGFAGVSNDTYGTLSFGRQNTRWPARSAFRRLVSSVHGRAAVTRKIRKPPRRYNTGSATPIFTSAYSVRSAATSRATPRRGRTGATWAASGKTHRSPLP